jgi:predicted transposase YbfD/YdcC
MLLLDCNVKPSLVREIGMQSNSVVPVRLDIASHFANVPDPRHPAFQDHHRLGDILFIALCAVLSGSRSWEAIAEFGRCKETWLRSLGLALAHGVPSQDTFNRVFAALDPFAFQRCFRSWIDAVCAPLGLSHIPIDGKTVRGSRGPNGTALHLVSAWAAAQRVTLAQVAVADKSNEITALPELLRLLNVNGALVSIDAMGCQKAIAQQIRDQGGDYLLAVKDNQPTLHADLQGAFADLFARDFEGVPHDVFVTEETSHGRQEERVYLALYETDGLSTAADWVDLKTLVKVLRIRRHQGQESVEEAYYISSRAAPAARLAEGIRTHWSIENGQHWCLDVLFGEDRCRSRRDHAAENLAWLRRMTLSLLRQDGHKGTAPTKQQRAALDDDYRLHLLSLIAGKYA